MTASPDGASAARLDFHRDRAASTVLDGGWRPRSRNPATELASLISALDAEDTPVNLIMLNPEPWLGRPPRIEVAGRMVRVVWSVDLDRTVLIAMTDRARRLQLLIDLDDAGAQ